MHYCSDGAQVLKTKERLCDNLIHQSCPSYSFHLQTRMFPDLIHISCQGCCIGRSEYQSRNTELYTFSDQTDCMPASLVRARDASIITYHLSFLQFSFVSNPFCHHCFLLRTFYYHEGKALMSDLLPWF